MDIGELICKSVAVFLLTQTRIPYAFLFDVANRFRSSYGDKVLSAAPMAMNDAFSRVLRERMEFFSNERASDKISMVQGQIDEAKDAMAKNIGML